MHTVLVVDDEEDVLFLLRVNLALNGFAVHDARDGEEAVASALQLRPDCVLLDWMMPGMDGIEVCRRVRESGRPVYILLVTARAGKQRVVEGLEAGADDYLVKPFDNEELRARIQVGARILQLQAALTARVQELEATQAENRELKLRIPL